MPDDLEQQPRSKAKSLEMGLLALLVVAFLIISLIYQRPFSGKKGFPEIMESLGIIIAAGITLVMYSFLYRDNALFKIAENLYVGVALGYSAILTWHEALKPEVYQPLFTAPTSAALLSELMHRTVPIILGILLLTRLSRKYSWVSRYAYALMIGWGAGVAIPLMTHSYILKQLHSAMAPLQAAPGPQAAGLEMFSGGWFLHVAAPMFGAVVLVLGTVSVLFYFFFSVEHKGVGGVVSKIGIWFLMISFGASFGYTVMGRLSLLIGRVQFLLFEWLKIKGQ